MAAGDPRWNACVASVTFEEDAFQTDGVSILLPQQAFRLRDNDSSTCALLLFPMMC